MDGLCPYGVYICKVLFFGGSLLVDEHGPRVLDHVFAAVHPNGLWVILFIFIGVAIDFGDVDIAFVMAFDEDIVEPRFLQGVLDVGD